MEGILRLSQQLPTDQRSWEQFLRRLNQQIQYDGERAVISALATISERTGTDFDTLLTYLNDSGRATDQRLLPMVNFGNICSVQSTDPLSATIDGGTATINVTAHTLHLDFGNVAYNSGSITGLVLNTRYYVYADDPNYAGGAVTYVASTSKPNVPANTGRYFVGTIVTPLSANVANISAATSANPIKFTTAASHGWSDGNTVSLAGLPGDFAALNGNSYSITVVDSDEFTVAVNGAAFAAYTSGGTATLVPDDTFPDWGGGGGGYIP
jgi:hypothetical protein